MRVGLNDRNTVGETRKNECSEHKDSERSVRSSMKVRRGKAMIVETREKARDSGGAALKCDRE